MDESPRFRPMVTNDYIDGYRKGASDCAGSLDKLDMMERERDSAMAQRDGLLAALKLVVEMYGPWHDHDCPCDDTCDCSAKPIHDAINDAFAKADGR